MNADASDGLLLVEQLNSIVALRTAACFGCLLLTLSVVDPSRCKAASFSCAQAKTFVEKAVCGDATLSHKDDVMAALYRERHAGDPSAASLARQRAWLVELASCQTTACVSALYDRRIAELTDRDEGNAADGLSVQTGPSLPAWSGFYVIPPDSGGQGAKVAPHQNYSGVAADPGTPGALAGLRPGDLIVSADNQPIRHWWDVYTIIDSKVPGEAVSLAVVRNGRPMSILLQLSQPPPGFPYISSISDVADGGGHRLIIRGGELGTTEPYNGRSNWLLLTDLSQNITAGGSGDPLGLSVSSWTPNQIIVSGFLPPAGSAGYVFGRGDSFMAIVCNPGSGVCRAVATSTLNQPFVVKAPVPQNIQPRGASTQKAATIQPVAIPQSQSYPGRQDGFNPIGIIFMLAAAAGLAFVTLRNLQRRKQTEFAYGLPPTVSQLEAAVEDRKFRLNEAVDERKKVAGFLQSNEEVRFKEQIATLEREITLKPYRETMPKFYAMLSRAADPENRYGEKLAAILEESNASIDYRTTKAETGGGGSGG